MSPASHLRGRNLSSDEAVDLVAKMLDQSVGRVPEEGAQYKGAQVLEGYVDAVSREFDYRLLIDFKPVPKRWSRCVDKVFEYIEQEEKQGRSLSEVDAILNWLKDLAGGRIIVVFPDDRERAVRRFLRYITSIASSPRSGIGEFRLDGEPDTKDYPNGYKAVHQGMYVQLDDGTEFPFEVQFMTAFQHIWDKVQHPVYERSDHYSTEVHEALTCLATQCGVMSRRVELVLSQIALEGRRRGRRPRESTG